MCTWWRLDEYNLAQLPHFEQETKRLAHDRTLRIVVVVIATRAHSVEFVLDGVYVLLARLQASNQTTTITLKAQMKSFNQ